MARRASLAKLCFASPLRGDRESPACERPITVRFDHQVQVIALNRVVHDAKTVPRTRFTQAHAERPDKGLLAQRRKAAPQAYRHVRGLARKHTPTAAVQDARAVAAWSARAEPGPAAAGVMTCGVEGELPWHGRKVRAMVDSGLSAAGDTECARWLTRRN